MATSLIKSWLEKFLACPHDKAALTQLDAHTLVCPAGHKYQVINGIPILLTPKFQPTQDAIFNNSLHLAASYPKPPQLQGKQAEIGGSCGSVDPYIQKAIGSTNGIMYDSLTGKLSGYPIPDFPLSCGQGRFILDIGCNWGRWCISAYRQGYIPIGIDHNLEALLAARRIAEQINVPAYYILADARLLPFAADSFDAVFSYSVFQHLSDNNVRIALGEISRVLKTAGSSMVQVANKFGLRSFYHQLSRGFRRPVNFEVRYRSPQELSGMFSSSIGPSTILADGFFSLNPQIACISILPLRYRPIVILSEALKKLTHKLPLLKYFADSLYLKSNKRIRRKAHD